MSVIPPTEPKTGLERYIVCTSIEYSEFLVLTNLADISALRVGYQPKVSPVFIIEPIAALMWYIGAPLDIPWKIQHHWLNFIFTFPPPISSIVAMPYPYICFEVIYKGISYICWEVQKPHSICVRVWYSSKLYLHWCRWSLKKECGFVTQSFRNVDSCHWTPSQTVESFHNSRNGPSSSNSFLTAAPPWITWYHNLSGIIIILHT